VRAVGVDADDDAPVGISIVCPRWVASASMPRTRTPCCGEEPPARKLLSGEVTTRTAGTHVLCPPSTQSPYCTEKAPLGSCVASVMFRPWNERPSQ